VSSGRVVLVNPIMQGVKELVAWGIVSKEVVRPISPVGINVLMVINVILV